MKRFTTVLTGISFLFLLSFSLLAGDRFDRSAVLPAQPDDIGGFGNIVAGVDLDGDGKVEIYTVNDDWHDVAGKDWVPRIYKYEKNDMGKWEIVWWTRLKFSFQNTWPALAVGDLDKDGKWEVIWGPVNNLKPGNLNPPRIVVFETAGDGSDVMGIDNGDGTFSPNASWTIASQDNIELRPFRWFVYDIDNDGTDEIVASARRG
ncbi:MAG: VCBS repeat-containing protein, partial [Calditrichaeota bacterium]